MAKVLDLQSRREMSEAYNSLVEGVKFPEVHMHPDDYELYEKWCETSDLNIGHKGVLHFRGSPVKTGKRFKAIKGKVIFARGCMCADASINFVEEADFLEESNCLYISRKIQETFDSFTPERKERFIALLEKKAEELRKTFLNQV